jgi:hypothetical protein
MAIPLYSDVDPRPGQIKSGGIGAQLWRAQDHEKKSA